MRIIVEVSKVERVKEELKVIDGPLLGFEHMIKNFSSRNRRITVEIQILEEVKRIELEGILLNTQKKNVRYKIIIFFHIYN